MQNFDKMDPMHFIRKLPIPQELKKEMPLTPELVAYKDKRDQEIAAIIRGRERQAAVGDRPLFGGSGGCGD